MVRNEGIDERLGAAFRRSKVDTDLTPAVMAAIAGRTPIEVARDRVAGLVRQTCAAAAALFVVLAAWAWSLSGDAREPQQLSEPLTDAGTEPVLEVYFDDPLGGSELARAAVIDSIFLGDVFLGDLVQ